MRKALAFIMLIILMSHATIAFANSSGSAVSPSSGGGGSSGGRVLYPPQGGYIPDVWHHFLESADVPDTIISGTIFFEESFDEDVDIRVYANLHINSETSVTLPKGANSLEYEVAVQGIGTANVSAVLVTNSQGYYHNWYCIEDTSVRGIVVDGSGVLITDADIIINKPRKISGNFYLPDNFWESTDDNKIGVSFYVQPFNSPHYDLGNAGQYLYKENNETVIPFEFYLMDFNEDNFILFYSIEYINYPGNVTISPYGYYKLNGETGLDLDDNVKLPAKSYEDIEFYSIDFPYSDEWQLTLIPEMHECYGTVGVEVTQINTDRQPVLLFAAYEDGSLIKMDKFYLSPKAVRYNFHPSSLWYTFDDKIKNKQVRVFLWDSLEGLKPLFGNILVDFLKIPFEE